MKIKLFVIAVIGLFLIAGCGDLDPIISKSNINKFDSGEDLIKAFEEAGKSSRGGFLYEVATGSVNFMKAETSKDITDSDSSVSYSETNVQVEGVDEADIIKTDGKHIYIVNRNNLIITKAYPEEDAKILSKTDFEGFNPNEIFIGDDKLLIFGNSYYNFDNEAKRVGESNELMIERDYYYNSGFTTAKLYDVSNKEEPELLKTFDFEGNYLTSRKIGSDVYFVINSYPRIFEGVPCEEIVPLFRESESIEKPIKEDFIPIITCTDVGYVNPIQAESFITIASIDMDNENRPIKKEVIVGSGQNVYASKENIYVAQTTWPRYDKIGELIEGFSERTVVTKFELDDGDIEYRGNGEVKGHILNQFSMDEYDDHFRIATTKGQVWGREEKSTNNVYVLNKDLDVVGELEDLAPGEKIYSVRFMGKKGYVVTFKKVDPLFVIDLENHKNPKVLGKLKIPGYSDYLHPYDENHIIGIGKDTTEAEDSLKEGRQLDFAWYQGVKMAIFDVSDVSNPIEMHKVIIGDRGTNSEALHNHKAFLFDKEKNLLVLPITLAEIKGEKTRDNQYGEYTFQGAYVYDITLDNGFDLKGRVTHYDDEEVFLKSGYYFQGDRNVRRSLYIGDVLYTMSDYRLQLNDLSNLDRLKVLEFGKEVEEDVPIPEQL